MRATRARALAAPEALVLVPLLAAAAVGVELVA